MSNILKELRAAVNAKTSTPGVDPGFDSAMIDAVITRGIADLSPKFSELYNMVPRKSLNGQGSKIWNVRISDNDSTRWAYSYSESVVTSTTNENTAGRGTHVQLSAVPKSIRTDWEVENFFREISASYYDSVNDEITNAIVTQVDKIEQQLVLGTAGGDSNGYLGLKQLISANNVIGDTSSIYGVTRAGSAPYMDAQVVNAAGNDFVITNLDALMTALKKQRAQPGFFLVSYERQDEINAQLQVQQRYAGTTSIDGGFVVPTYRGLPIIQSKYMETAGASNGDTCLYLVGKDNFFLYETGPMRSREATLGRQDSVGGFIVHYATTVVPRLTHNAILHNVAAPNI